MYILCVNSSNIQPSSILEQRLAHWLHVSRIMAEATPSTCGLPSSTSHVLGSFLTPNAKGLV